MNILNRLTPAMSFKWFVFDVQVLNRAIRTAQNEVNDSIGLKHLYIVLENGFYVTSRFPRGQVIAKVSADQEWRKKNFGED